MNSLPLHTTGGRRAAAAICTRGTWHRFDGKDPPAQAYPAKVPSFRGERDTGCTRPGRHANHRGVALKLYPPRVFQVRRKHDHRSAGSQPSEVSAWSPHTARPGPRPRARSGCRLGSRSRRARSSSATATTWRSRRTTVASTGGRPDVERALDFACQMAGRTLTEEEWEEFLPAQPYQSVCPDV